MIRCKTFYESLASPFFHRTLAAKSRSFFVPLVMRRTASKLVLYFFVILIHLQYCDISMEAGRIKKSNVNITVPGFDPTVLTTTQPNKKDKLKSFGLPAAIGIICGVILLIFLIVGMVIYYRSRLGNTANSAEHRYSVDSATISKCTEPFVLSQESTLGPESVSPSQRTVHGTFFLPLQREAALKNPMVNQKRLPSLKSASDVTQSLSSVDLGSDSSTVQSISNVLEKANNVQANAGSIRQHPETSKLETISTDTPPGPRECMNPRGEMTTSQDTDAKPLGDWPIQFMKRVLKLKRRSATQIVRKNSIEYI